MKIGDKVLYKGKIATIVNKFNPRCRCKGKYYELVINETDIIRVPLDTVLEPYKPLTMANEKLEVHKF